MLQSLATDSAESITDINSVSTGYIIYDNRA